MAQNELISQVVDPKAVEEVLKMTQALVELEGHLNAINKSGKGIRMEVDSAKSLNETNVAVERLTKNRSELTLAMKEYKAINDSIDKATAKLTASESDAAKVKAELILKTQQQNAELKAEARLVLAASGSLEQAEAANKKYRLEKKQLNLETVEGRKRLKELNDEIDKNTKFIKENEDAYVRQKMNIGNYSSAVNVLQKSLQDVRKSIDDNTRAGKGNSDQMQLLIREEQLLTSLVEDQVVGFASATAELRNNQKALQQMAASGLKATEAYKALEMETARLKDDVGDLKERLKNLGSDTKTLDGVIQGVQGIAGAFAIAQGAAALFGAEDEDLQKSMQKLQAIMAIVMGLQQLQNILQKESSFLILIQSARLKALSAAQWLYTRATAAATVQTISLKAALIGTGIGALLVLLGTTAAAMSTMGDSTDETTDSITKQAEALEKLHQLYNEVEQDTENIRNANAGGLNDLKRQLSAAEARGDSEAHLLDLKKQINDIEQLNIRIRLTGEHSAQDRVKLEQELKDKVQERGNLELSYNRKVSEEQKKQHEQDKKSREEAAKKAQEVADRELSAQVDLSNKLSGSRAEEYKRQADDEKLSLDDRLKALGRYYDEREFQIKAAADFETMSGEKTAGEIKVIELGKLNDLQALQLDKARETNAKLKAWADEETRYRIEAVEKITLNLEQQQQEELNALTAQLRGRKLTVQEYENSVEFIRQKYAKKGLDDTSSYLEELVNDERLTADERVDIQKRLDEARVQSSEFANNKILEDERKLADARKQLQQELVSSFKALVNSMFERQLANSDKRLQDIDDEKQAEIDKINAEAISAEKKQERIQIAEAKAAQQHLQLEAKKKEIQKQQAIFEKGASIASIIAKTAEAVMSALKIPVIGSALAGIYGAIGAAQLATVIATPAFAEGVESSPEGWAITDEKGPEGYIEKSGKAYIGSDKGPTLRYLKQGTRIIPHDQLMDIVLGATMKPVQGETANEYDYMKSFIKQYEATSKKSTREIVDAVRGVRQDTSINMYGDFNAYIRKNVKGR